MKTVMLYLLFGMVAFSLAAAGSWFYLEQQKEKETAAANEAAADEPMTPIDPETLPSDLPVAVAGTPMTAEEIFRIGATYRTRQEAIEKREAELKKQELRFQLIHKDIEAQQREFDGLLAQVRDTIASGEKTLARLQQERAQLESETQEFDKKMEKLDTAGAGLGPGEAANLKQFGSLLEGMQPDAAAATLAELINDGNIDDAVQLVRSMEARNASKILDALPTDLRTAFIEAYKTAPVPPKPGRR